MKTIALVTEKGGTGKSALHWVSLRGRDDVPVVAANTQTIASALIRALFLHHETHIPVLWYKGIE
jgi:hypothetical protein